jgi:hypothetical protein
MAAGAAMDERTPRRLEARWPVALGIICVLVVLAVLPDRVRLVPQWVNVVLALAVLAPIGAVSLRPAKAALQRVERVVVLAFVVLAGVGTLKGLGQLLREVAGRTAPIGGLPLLESSIALWGLNVLTFSLLYWQMDRGGPGARADGQTRWPDWTFPQAEASADDVPRGWTPSYPDYLFLAFCTATAFSPTDALPLTTRAKMLMMAESLISLTTLALVASRAINILGS